MAFHIHWYSKWMDVEDSECEVRQEKHCYKCNKMYVRALRTKHDWGKWEIVRCSGKSKRVCNKCGESQIKDSNVDTHDWSEWKPILSPNKCIVAAYSFSIGQYYNDRRNCNYCGLTQVKKVRL